MGTEVRAEQRQAILAILVSLIACMAVSASTTNLITDVSSVAGTLTFAASFYAMLLFVLHLRGVEFVRPATVRRWQALVVLCVTALSAWGLVFRMRSRLSGGLRHLLRNPILAGLLFGPWRGLLPASKGAREK